MREAERRHFLCLFLFAKFGKDVVVAAGCLSLRSQLPSPIWDGEWVEMDADFVCDNKEGLSRSAQPHPSLSPGLVFNLTPCAPLFIVLSYSSGIVRVANMISHSCIALVFR